MNGWPKAHVEKQNSAGFHSDFHNYQVNWTPDFIEFSIDDEVVRIVECRQSVRLFKLYEKEWLLNDIFFAHKNT